MAEDADLSFSERFFSVTGKARQVVGITVGSASFTEFTDRLAGAIPEQGSTEDDEE